MSDLKPLGEVWRRSMDAYVQYYGAVGQLTVNYLKDLLAAWGEFRIPSMVNVAAPAFTTSPAVSPRKTEVPQAPQPVGVMVLEGEAGSSALGVFLIENHLGHEVSARVTASSFTAPDNSQVQPALVFDPEIIALRPGEQLLVRAMAMIDETLETDVRYEGEFTVPELTGTRIPVVLRRRLSQSQPTLPTSPSESAGRASKKGKSIARRRAAKAKRAATGKKG